MQVGRAFAPAAITNFFAINYNSSSHPIGATGGGYILSKGTTSTAGSSPSRHGAILTSVNGDPEYQARTTRRAVGLLLAAAKRRSRRIKLEQSVDVPIGSGFGASAASATSAVYAAAASVGIRRSKRGLAFFAHRAEILEQTGLGTVSAIYDAVGAGAITLPGVPGLAEFVNVKVPRNIRIVTACLAPYDKKEALSSETVSARINRLGERSLEVFLSDPTLDTLASEGERFSADLGLESPEVKKLIRKAKSAGARYASQNMIGYAIHSLVPVEDGAKVAKALCGYGPEVRVDTFSVGSRRAGVLVPRGRWPVP